MRLRTTIGPYYAFLRLLEQAPPLVTPARPHAATISLTYRTMQGGQGVPVTHDTHQAIQDEFLRLAKGEHTGWTAQDGESLAFFLFMGLAHFCPPVMAQHGGIYGLERLDLGLTEATPHGDKVQWYSAEAGAAEEVSILPDGGHTKRDQLDPEWVRARLATWSEPPSLELPRATGNGRPLILRAT